MKIFLSYSRDDKAFVAALRTDLSQLGHDVWMDQRLLGGQEWWDEILGNIRGCDLFVLALSPKSIESDACLLEVKYARAIRRPFLPVTVLPTDPNFFPPEVAQAQFVDYTASSDRESLLHLVAAITRLPPTPPLPDPLPEPPVMPQGPLYEVRRLIALATELDRKHQLWLLDTLQQNSVNPRLRPDVTELLTEFRRRHDLMVDVLAKVDALLRSLQGDRPQTSPARPKAWLAVLIVGELATLGAAAEFPTSSKAQDYYSVVLDFLAAAVIFGYALGHKPRFLGWWLILSAFALDGLWGLSWPLLMHRNATLNSWVGEGAPIVFLTGGMILFRSWQAGRRSIGHALVAMGAAAGAVVVAVASMPSGWVLNTFGYAATAASVLPIGAAVWLMLERGTTALIRLGFGAVAVLVYLYVTFFTHALGPFTIWMASLWQVAGFILASIAAFAAARWPAAKWPTLGPRARTGHPSAVPATSQ